MKKLLILMLFAGLFACDKKSDGDNDKVDFERTAEYLYVYFYGDEYSQEQGTMNYFVSFSDAPLGGDITFEWLYTIDLYANEGSLDKIPNGTYTLDIDSSCMGGTLAYADCVYFEGTEYESPFTEANLVVTDSKIVLTATTEDGKTHKVTYNGDYEVIDDREDSGSEDGGGSEDNGSDYDSDYGNWSSTLTDDVVVEYNDDYAFAEYYGDDYGMGYGVLNFYFEKEDYTGHTIYLEVATTDSSFGGTYSPCKTWDTAAPGNLVAANINDGLPYGGCWYFYSENGEEYNACAPIVAGSLIVTNNGDNTYTFDFEGYDAIIEESNKITFNWTGEIYYENYTEESSAKRIYPLKPEVKVLAKSLRSQKGVVTKYRK